MYFFSLVHFRGTGPFERAHSDDGLELRGECGTGERAEDVPKCDGPAANVEQYYGDSGDGTGPHSNVLRDAVHGPAGDPQTDRRKGGAVLGDAIFQCVAVDLQESWPDGPEYVVHISAAVVRLVRLQAVYGGDCVSNSGRGGQRSFY